MNEIRYTVTGLFRKDQANIINSTLDFNTKKGALDCIKENFARNEFDTLLIRRHDSNDQY